MSDIDNVSWNYPTPIWFGLGRSLEIPNALEAQGMQNPLVVTDPEFTSNKNFCLLYTSPSPRDGW